MASIDKRTIRTSLGTEARYDVRFRDPRGQQRKRTVRTRREADRLARTVEVEEETGSYVAPGAGRVLFGDYARDWLEHRPTLRPRTRELYEGQLRNHLLPTFGEVPLSAITPATVRAWWSDLHETGLSDTSCSKLYRLLRTILGTAENDGLIGRNPCAIDGAAVERSAERPVATVEQVWRLADAMPRRLRCLVLVFGFLGLRLGEALGLERRHVDLESGAVRVEQQEQELRDGRVLLGPPKTEAGVRTLAVPGFLVEELAEHLERFTDPEPEARLFTGAKGGTLRRHVFQRHWERAKAQVPDLPPGFHAHDLRHTANTITAATGASTKELMSRMGHASTAAAIRYQHATRERDRAIADLADLVGEIGAPDRTSARSRP